MNENKRPTKSGIKEIKPFSVRTVGSDKTDIQDIYVCIFVLIIAIVFIAFIAQGI